MSDWYRTNAANSSPDWWLTKPADNWWDKSDANVDGPIGGGGSPALRYANDFFDRLENESLTLSAERKSAYLTFLTDGQNSGWLDHMLEIVTWEGDTLLQVAHKLVYRPGDSVTLTNSGYTSDGINTNGGCKMTGTTAFWSTFNGNDLTTNTGGFHAWLRESPPKPSGGNIIFSGVFSTINLGWASNTRLRAFWGSSILSAGSSTISNAGRGMYSIERSSNALLSCHVNNTLLGIDTTVVSDTTRSSPLQYAIAPSPMDLGAISDGQMTTEQRTAFTLATAQLMESLGRLPSVTNLRTTLIVGQSNASSGTFAPAISTAQSAYELQKPMRSYSNPAIPSLGVGKMFESGFETIASGLANTVALLRRAVVDDTSYDMAVENVSSGGLSYAFLKKGGSWYSTALNSVAEMHRISNLAFYAGATINPVVCVHGESDLGSTTYAANLVEWQADYEADLTAITGESKTVPMLHSQVSSFGQDSPARSTYAMLAAHEANPSKIVLVGPKYSLNYVDGIHLTNTSMRLLGDYYGKAMYAILSGGTFTPLRPTSLVRSGAVITISFTGRVGDLVLDDTTIDDPGNFGFQWVQVGGTARAISSIALANSNTQLEITLDGDPGAPSAQSIIYAGPATAGNATGFDGGPSTGPRGCVRDSDATEGFSEIPLWNWLVHFEKTVS